MYDKQYFMRISNGMVVAMLMIKSVTLDIFRMHKANASQNVFEMGPESLFQTPI